MIDLGILRLEFFFLYVIRIKATNNDDDESLITPEKKVWETAFPKPFYQR